MPFAASSAMLRRRGQVSGGCLGLDTLAAFSTSYREPREQNSARQGQEQTGRCCRVLIGNQQRQTAHIRGCREG